jgi:hypothetical protein
MFELIGEKEIIRPGIAGAYWSEWSFCREHVPIDPIAWMMDILSRRSGPEPDGLPFNGIDFHLHELCGTSPDMVTRMLRLGHPELAIQTATEMLEAVPGMEPVLRELAENAAPGIRHKAQFHLAHYYRVLHPEAEASGLIRRRAGWSPEAELFSFHHGEARALWFVTLYPRDPDSRFDEATAWLLVDRLLPPALRGDLVAHHLDLARGPAPRPFRLGRQMMWRFASGACVDLTGDPDAGTWSRIDVMGLKLGQLWAPFAE